MAQRYEDWLRQARRDLEHARHSLRDQGHSLTQLLETLPDQSRASRELIEAAKLLDKHYVTTRYPNGFASGAPALQELLKQE